MTKTTMCKIVHSIGFFVLSAFLLCCPPNAFAETTLFVRIVTGSDDLRGGNTAFISLVRTDGRVIPEQVLSGGEGGGAESIRSVTFPETVSARGIRSIRIRHDGNPRSGHPFDTYDNWNLSALRVQLVDASCRTTWHLLYDSARDRGFTGVRFTGALRQIDSPVRATVPPTWCISGQVLRGDVNGDGQVDAVCHDPRSGAKRVALRESADLVETWADPTSRWCTHAGAALFIGDVNGDNRADLICKDPSAIWFDYNAGEGRYFQGAGPRMPTTWCTGAGDTFFVGDQNNDGRADLVCRRSDGFYRVDFADSSGRFGGTDASGLAPDFEVTDITRSGTGYVMSIRNNGADGYATSFWCSSNNAVFTASIRIPPDQTRTYFFSSADYDPDVVTCWAGGQSRTGVREIFTSNNSLTKCLR